MSGQATIAVTDAELALILERRKGNATAVIEPPNEPTKSTGIVLGSKVLYTSQSSGKTREYTVRWIGSCKERAGVTRLGLPIPRRRGLFFVDAALCRLA